MNRNHLLLINLSILVLISVIGCGPKAPVERYSKWSVIELRDELSNDYDRAWKATAEALIRLKWPIEKYYKDIGYLQTRWVSRRFTRRERLTIKFTPGEKRKSIEIRTEALWLDFDPDDDSGEWKPVSNPVLNRKLYFDLVSQLGRTEPTE